MVNLVKSEFSKAQVVFFGNVVGQSKDQQVKAKVGAIDCLTAPKGKKELMIFLGMAGWYRTFCKHFSLVLLFL